MKLTITEQRTNNIEIEKKVTILNVSPFDTGVGAVPLSLFTGIGYLLIGNGVGSAIGLPPGNLGEVLTADPAQPLKMRWMSGGGGASSTMTNNSGGSVVVGDVIVNDSTVDKGFRTTTAPQDTRVLGVAGEGIASGAQGKVLTFPGTIVTINCDTGAVARGDFLGASSTVKLAASYGPVRQGSNGVFALALTAKAAGSSGTVVALLIATPYYGTTGVTGYVLGGQGVTWQTRAEKYSLSTLLPAALASGALPVARGYGSSGQSTTAGFTFQGQDSGTVVQAGTNRLPWATEITADDAGAASPAGARVQSGTCMTYPGIADYWYRGYTTAYVAATSKHTHASDISSNLTAALAQVKGYVAMMSDGVRYGMFVGGYMSTPAYYSNADKMDFTTDTIAVQASAATPSTSSGYTCLNYVGAGVSYFQGGTTTLLSGKWPHATLVTAAVGSSPAADTVYNSALSDGQATGLLMGNNTTPFQNAQTFNRVTETYALAASSNLIVGAIHMYQFANGAI